LNWSLLKAGLVDEIYQTICPVIIGGRNAPTMADGDGAKKLTDAIRLRTKSMKRIGDELYLVHEVLRPDCGGLRKNSEMGEAAAHWCPVNALCESLPREFLRKFGGEICS